MFTCNECGARAPRWQGRCNHCGAWSSLEAPDETPRPRPLAEFAATPLERRTTGYAELDRALGGGLVPGSAILLGGEPGIGKSTLLLAMCARVGGSALYVAGEESPQQVALRARRLGLDPGTLLVLDETDTNAIADVLREERPDVCVVDSVQTVRTPDVEGAPGGPAQVRAAADRLVPAAREMGGALVLVGQVTKVGGLAGPRLLEHAVDTVLFFEGDRHTALRVLRPVKNRYGPTDEIGLFEMRDDGLREVRDASQLLLSERIEGPGAAVACVVQGRRALCVEVQALAIGENRTAPRRRARGIDPRRVELLVAVVASNYALELNGRDVLANVVGGLEVTDTALDLAVAGAVLSSHWFQEVPAGAVLIGEVGLRGEVRAVPHLATRLKEIKAMGFERVYAPPGVESQNGLAVTEVAHVRELFPPRAPPEEIGLPPGQ